jgi:hypothetical protein
MNEAQARSTPTDDEIVAKIWETLYAEDHSVFTGRYTLLCRT